jgi:replicative DNA helicase
MSLRPSFARVLDLAEQARKNPGQMHGLMTGISTLDKRLRGLRGFVLCGARPSMGKTTFVQTVIKNVCEESVRSGLPKTVGFLSAEMSKEDLARRWLCMTSGVRAEDLDLGVLSPNDMQSLYRAKDEMERWPLLVEDRRSPDINYVQDTFWRWMHEAGDSLSLIVVDHMGEITSPSAGNDYRAATDVATMLANASEELDVPVLAAAQLSRKVEDRENKRPQLSDFRDSGKIEEKASCALLLYRKAYYEAQALGQDCPTAPMEIIVAKGRNTGTGTALVDFVPEYPRLEPHQNGNGLPKGI